jgi:hypothetical protein
MDALKGNFKPKKEVTITEDIEGVDIEADFEREAMKNLGGSIAFVKKKKVDWGDKENN